MGKRQISLDKVLNDSWKRMVQLLFRPFDFKFWLIIGFCAWMTILSIDLGSLMSRIVTPFFETMEQSVSVENAVHHVLKGTDGTFWSRLLQELEPATGIIWLVAGIYVVYLLLCLAAYWIRCRFEFVLLANLLRGTQEIRKPWQEYRKIGNSYFIGSILVNCIVFLYYVVILAVLTPQLIVYAGEISTHNELVLPGPGIWICAGLLMVSTIVISYYMWFFYQLLMPIMYRDNLTFRQGIRVMNRLVWKHFGICFLYYLVMMVVLLGGIIAFGVVSGLTCCIYLLVVTNVPYVRAILVLPFWVFFRLIGPRFLAELDPREPEPDSRDGVAAGEGRSIPAEQPVEP